MTTWRTWLVAGLTLAMGGFEGCLVDGCSAAYWANAYPPVTEVRVHKGIFGLGVSVKNTKDVDIAMEEVAWEDQEGFSMKKLVFSDKSSPVLDAQTRQQAELAKTMQVQVEYQRQIGQNIALGIAAGGEALSAVLGSIPNFGASIDTPYGSAILKTTANPPAVKAEPKAPTEPAVKPDELPELEG